MIMFLDEAYSRVLKTLPPDKTENQKLNKKKESYEKPEILAITGLTAHTMGILLESAEMFNATMANAMLEVANIFERQQSKLEEGITVYRQSII